MARVLHVSFALLLSARLHAQVPPPIHTYMATPSAASFLDSMSRDARRQRKENGACLVAYGVKYDTLLVGGFGKASYVAADSLHIYSRGSICPDGVPVIHSHIGFNGLPPYSLPSVTDVESAIKARTWAIVLVVGDTSWHLVLYP